ncbi:MAG: tripartite tricarboxylate transporter substrate-binding protein [Chloroflexota bacterium]|nr:tripartite tricarboxylate transporter substrate-binding protein [Chloroflexota bacterium]
MQSSPAFSLIRRLGVVLVVACTMLGSILPMGRVATAQGTDCPIEWPSGTLQIMAPAAPGGGWDGTAREMQRVLSEEQIVSTDVEVFNVEGAGGTIGLSELVNEHAGDENMMMVMGLVMIGGIGLNASPVTLDAVTPIARLTAEYEVIVVPANSPYQTLDDLIAAFQADPGAISWGGGSAGGTDHILVALLAQAVGIDPTLINYVPFSGGGEALASVLGGQTSAGVSGLGEWSGQIESGELRALAISGRADESASGTPGASPAASPAPTGIGSSIPTLQDQGVDLELANWRGIVAPPEISPEARACMVSTIETLVGSQAWIDTRNQFGWADFYLGGDEYTAYLQQEIETINTTLTELGLI